MYLYESVCLPTLLFGMEIMCLSDKLIKKLESFQGSLMKRSLGLSKFSHHSKLLEALNIPKVSDSINNMTISLWKRIFNVGSPARDLCRPICFLSKYVLNGKCIPDTLMGRVVKLGFSPTRAALSYNKPTLHSKPLDGIVDSLRSVIFNQNILSRGSSSHTLVKLLTKA